MSSRGFLIRFIDIGLIVLFGFIMISEIENISQVELAAVVEAEEPEEDEEERAFVTVEIDANGYFVVSDPEAGGELASGIVEVETLTGILDRLRLGHERDDRTMIVLIRPHEDSILQRTVDVMDVCDRLRLAKSLQMDLAPPEEV